MLEALLIVAVVFWVVIALVGVADAVLNPPREEQHGLLVSGTWRWSTVGARLFWPVTVLVVLTVFIASGDFATWFKRHL